MQNTTPHTTAAVAMNTTADTTLRPAAGVAGIQPLTNINGLRMSGIFPQGREPSIRTLRAWTYERRIPHHRLGHFIYYDIGEVTEHIRVKLMVPPRN